MSLGEYQKISFSRETKEDREELCKKYAPLVKITAYRLVGRLPSTHLVEDLISCGNIGLLEAINSFDPSLMIKFETFAKFRIRGAMIDEIRQRDWMPRSVRSKMRELDNLYRKLATELSRVPDDQDMAKALEMSLEEYYDMIVTIQPAGMISYEDISAPHMAEKSVIEFLEDRRSPNPDFEIQIKELKKRIIESLEQLAQDEQMVMALYYYEGLTFKEIAEVLKVTESRISQIHAKSLMKLHWRLDQFRGVAAEIEGMTQEG